MLQLEEPVKKTLEELKAKHRHHLALKGRSDGYYVFETMPKFDEKLQRETLLSFYVGKIEKDGKLIEPVRKRNSTRGVKNLDDYIQKRKRIELGEEKEAFESEYEPLILKELSTNPRDGIAAISKRLGLPYSTTLYWIRKLEKKYGIRYTAEHWFLKNFGLDRYISVAKFKNARPNASALKKLLEDNPYVQFAALTRGAYDLFLFLIAPNTSLAEEMVYQIRSSPVFARCPAEWYASYYQQGMGYMPLRDKFFDVLEKKVWHRTKETLRKQKDQLFAREYATLRELNSDGLAEFSKIDEKYGLKNGSAQYTYHKLIEEKLLNRITMTMDKPPVKDIAIIIAEQQDVNKFNSHKKEYFLEIISDGDTPLNKYIFEGDIGSPYGLLLIVPIYKDGDLEKIEDSLNKYVYGSEIHTSLISHTLTGKLGLRKVDTTKTWIYDTLVKDYRYSIKSSDSQNDSSD